MGYGNPDQAANASIALAKTLPNLDSLEYGGLIFKDANGWEFSLYGGTEGNIPIYVDGKTIVAAWWHTHPSYGGLDAFVFGAGNALNSEELSRCQGCDVDVTKAIDRQLQRYQGSSVSIGAYLYSIQSKTLYDYADPVADFSAKREVPQ
ncbi:MAG TPA: hypothetical protein VHU87_06770 [Rhizomicrobium sp.]|nr:hypothetical protein [Rhizomicrobium sp.]